MEYKGIDVSKYQGDINFNKVKKTDIDFVIIRIGYGMYESQKDEKFEKNYEGFKNVLIPIGVYHYTYAKNVNEAKLEAKTVLKWLNNRKLDLPVYFDIEDKSLYNLNKNTLTNICDAFCSEIEKGGYASGVYANKYFFNTYLDFKKLSDKYSIWVAQYSDINTFDGKYDMWQYSSSSLVNGINGNVDANFLYKDLFANTSLPDLRGYEGLSIVDGLKSAGYNSSFDSRSDLYKRVGFDDFYKGTSQQNEKLLMKLKGRDVGYYSSSYKGFSFVDGLKEIGVDASLANRKIIALKNGIEGYTGSYLQNIKLLKLLKSGKLVK